MANDINKVILTGNIGKKPVEKDANENSSYVSFSLAVNESYKKGEKWIDNTHWVYCQCWFSSVKKKALGLEKGTNICIEGSLNVYKPKDSQNSIVSVKVSRIISFRKNKSSEEEIKQPESQENDVPEEEPESDKEELPW